MVFTKCISIVCNYSILNFWVIVFIIIIIIGIYLYLFIQDRKNKGKENKETYLKTKELHDLSRDVHSDNYEISRAQAHMTFRNPGGI